MSKSFGANLQQVRASAKGLEQLAGQLEQAEERLRRRLADAVWEGPDATEFRSEWSSVNSAQIRDLVGIMQALSVDLIGQAKDQEITSQGGSPSPGTGAVAASSGFSGTAFFNETWTDGRSVTTFTDFDMSRSGDLWTRGVRAELGKGGIKTESFGSDVKRTNGLNLTETRTTDGEAEPTKNRSVADVDAKVILFKQSVAEFKGRQEEAKGTFGQDGEWDAKASAGGFVEARSEAGINKDGLFATTTGTIGALVQGSGSAKTTLGGATLGTSGTVSGGAEATALMDSKIGRDGVELKVGAEAFAGVKASLDGSLKIDEGEIKASAGVAAGLMAKFSASGSLTATKVGVAFDIGAAFGIGADIQFELSINPAEVFNTGKELVGDAVDLAGKGLDTGLDIASDVADGIVGAVKWIL
jgi:uncharacterized protein YukE